MRSRDAWIGKRVQVRPGYRKSELRGQVGTVEKRYGDPDYAALEVRFGDGRTELFWHYELDEADVKSPDRSWRRRVSGGG